MRQLAHLAWIQRRENDALVHIGGADMAPRARYADSALQAEGSLAAGVERATLERDESPDAGAGETQQIVQACPIERRLLGGALDLDEFAGARNDHVHVHGGAAILYIVQVQDWAPADDADADRRHAVADGRADAGLAKGVGDRDEAAGDRGRARSTVGLDDVAVDPDGALAHLGALDHGAQGAADEALDLLRATAWPAILARRPRVGRAWQHRVLRRHPAEPLPFQERRHLVVDRRGADDLGRAELHEHRALGMQQVVARHHDGAQLIGRAAVRARHQRSRVARGPGVCSRVRVSYFFL